MEEKTTLKVGVIRTGNLDIVSKVSFKTMEAIKSNESQKHFATEKEDFKGNSGTLEFVLREVSSMEEKLWYWHDYYIYLYIFFTFYQIYILHIRSERISPLVFMMMD